MGISDSVVVAIAISLSASPQTESISTPLLAGFHQHYAARYKEYEAAGGAGLSEMITDGFTVNDALYKAAAAVCAQSPSPANFAIGRRALPTSQTLVLTCIDATVGDSYNFTVVGGTDGAAHQVAYTIPANFGSAVSGTVAVVNGSPNITFSTSQTMAAGDLLVFASQPGVYYALSAAVTGTSGTLTANYLGTNATATTSTHLATLAGTFAVTNGSANVPTTSSQVGTVSVGDTVQFVAQLGTYYTVEAVAAGALTLSVPYSGTTNGASHGSDISTIGSVASAIETTLAGLGDLGTVSVTANVITLARTDGKLNDIQGWLSNGFANIELQDTSADPGVATDLAAIYAADKLDWYSLALDSNSANEIKDAALWIEATGQGGKVFFTNTSDWQNYQSSVTSDVFSALQTLGYKKTHIQQNNSQLLCYAGASTAGYTGARNAGSYALAQAMTLPGVPCDTETTLTESEALIINAHTASSPTTLGKGGNFYKVTAGLNASFWGYTPAGGFMDTTIFIDWLQVNMQADVFAVLAGLPKVPFTDIGIGLIVDAIDTRLNIGASAAYGGIDGTQPITVSAPAASAVDQVDKAARNLPNVTWTATLAGAVETTVIQGTLID